MASTQMSAAEATALVRSLIKESAAKFWSDAEITLYLKVGMQTTWAKFLPWLYELKKTWANLATTINSSTVTPPTDCYKIGKIIVKTTGKKIRYIGDDEIFKYLTLNSNYTVWTWKAGNIHLIPAPDASDTDYYEAYYIPRYTDITSFPDSLQVLACVNAAILAKSKDEDVDQYLLDLRAYQEQAATIELATINEGEPYVFPDYREDDAIEIGTES